MNRICILTTALRNRGSKSKGTGTISSALFSVLTACIFGFRSCQFRMSAFFPPLLSIVIPVFRGGQVVGELLQRLTHTLEVLATSYEIILVDDASPEPLDWQLIQEAAWHNPRIKGLSLARNFGQHYALTAGLDASTGEWIVVMDCDLQDQPEEIPRLLAKAQQGYEAVMARRGTRTDGRSVRGGSWLFYKALAYLTGTPQDPEVGNFGIYHRRLIDVVLQMRETTRYFPTLVRWAGFRQTTVDVEHGQSPRSSSYSLLSRLRLALDILLTYSDKPLRLAVYFGLLLSGAAFCLGFIMLFRYFLGQITVPGYASLIISVSLFSGIIISLLGIVGLYVGKTFEGVRARPLYVVAKTTEAA